VNQLAGALQERGYTICAMTVYTLLVEMGYSLQSNRKTPEGKQHPDRDGQFQHIARQESLRLNPFVAGGSNWELPSIDAVGTC
jgi:hypothetical protein